MRPLLLGAFEINGVNLTSQGLWAHPEQNTVRYKSMQYWIELAQLLDSGGFEFMFLADSYGYPSLDGVTPPLAFEQAVEIPKNDPMLLIPALAAATRQLSFGVTSSTTFEQPYANARRFATLDHLTQGRIAWNAVTTSSAVVADLFGSQRFIPHDERYLMAQEFMDVSYALFEGSWEDGSVLADKAARRYADPTRIHPVTHHGRYFDVEGYFNCEPSPQRTPVIFQAGSSSAGRAFAARNAEVVFLQGRDVTTLSAHVNDLRARAMALGRGPDAIKTVVGLSVVVGRDRAEAQAKLEDYLSYVNPDAARVYYASMTGVDLASLDPAASFATVTTQGGLTQVERYRGLTVAEATADFQRYGMREFVLVGSAEQIVDDMADLVKTSGVDGFNYTPFVSPGSYREFVDHIVPELRRRGMLQIGRESSTFRERLFGHGQARLPADHPASAYRHRPAADTAVAQQVGPYVNCSPTLHPGREGRDDDH